MESFRPGPQSSRAYRQALGCFGTGVTVVTCRDEFGALSIAANSFASVSLDPPLVLWSPAIASSRHDAFVAARRFSIHVLAETDEPICQAAALGGRDFDPKVWHEDAHGVPILDRALVRLDCTHHASHGAGDHTIVLGLVDQVTHRPGTPLLFVQGRYGGFSTGS